MANTGELDGMDVDEVSSILSSPSTLSQLNRLSKTHPSFAELASFISDPKYRHYDVSSKLWVGKLRAQGSYADVYEGKLLSGIAESALESLRGNVGRLRGRLKWGYDKIGFTKVAVKRIRIRPDAEKDFARAICREISIWAQLSHENILVLLGVALVDGAPSLVSKWMENGNLAQFLRQHEPDESAVANLALQIARGLSYLHVQGIIHCDLKSGNILIGDDLHPLLCDFGISRLENENEAKSTIPSSNLAGSVRWMAIEVIQDQMYGSAPLGKRCNTVASDVWSYGMVLYELLTRKVPYYETPSEAQVILEISTGGLPRPPSFVSGGDFLYKALWRICVECWTKDPSQRPSLSEIIKELQDAIKAQSPGLTLGESATCCTQNAYEASLEDVVSDANIDQLSTSELRSDHIAGLRTTSYGARPRDPLTKESRSPFASILFEDPYQQSNLTSRVLVRELRGSGDNADIFKGKMKKFGDIVRTEDLEDCLRYEPEAFIDVAVKQLRTPVESTRSILRELRIWMQLRHQNILQLIGFTVVDGAFALITPWMERGDLRDYLKASTDVDVCCIALGVASGLAYLHSVGVVHANLRTDNILVSNEGWPLLTGFGISRLNYDGITLSGASILKGNVRWMAIELIEPGVHEQRHNFHTRQSDIWAFGMVVYELLSREIPYPEITNDMRVLLAIVSGKVPRKPECDGVKNAEELWQICIQCWGRDPASRPSASNILNRLASMCTLQEDAPTNRSRDRTTPSPSRHSPRAAVPPQIGTSNDRTTNVSRQPSNIVQSFFKGVSRLFRK